MTTLTEEFDRLIEFVGEIFGQQRNATRTDFRTLAVEVREQVSESRLRKLIRTELERPLDERLPK